MATKPLASAVHEAADPLLEAIARAPLGPPESPEERAAVKAAMAESEGGAHSVEHEAMLRKLADPRR